MKYIDVEKLKRILQSTINLIKENNAKGEKYDAFLNGKLSICEELLGCIDSFQQVDFPTTDKEIKIFLANNLKVEVPDKYKTLDWLWKKEEEIDLEKEINKFLQSEKSTTYENTGTYKVAVKDPKKIARYFYELGQQEMRRRIMNPKYNEKVIEQLKSEYPVINKE